MYDCPVNCTFVWHGVVPPSHCPHCGRCLGCGAPQPWRPPYGPGKVYPEHPPTVPYPRPYWGTTSYTYRGPQPVVMN